MRDLTTKGLHPVRFSKKQVRFIEHMIHGKVVGLWEADCDDILSTIEKSIIKDSRKPLTEGKMLSNVKEAPTTGPPSGPPGQGKPKAKKCYHANIRLTGMGPTLCPDCYTNVWPSDMINIILNAIRNYLPGSPYRDLNGRD